MIKWRIEYMEDVNNGLQKVEDVERFAIMYKSVFHAMCDIIDDKKVLLKNLKFPGQ